MQRSAHHSPYTQALHNAMSEIKQITESRPLLWLRRGAGWDGRASPRAPYPADARAFFFEKQGDEHKKRTNERPRKVGASQEGRRRGTGRRETDWNWKRVRRRRMGGAPHVRWGVVRRRKAALRLPRRSAALRFSISGSGGRLVGAVNELRACGVDGPG